jgi:uncharacterized protein YegL
MNDVMTSTDGIAGQASHLKLYILWLVDVSGSMRGSRIQQVNWAIKQVLPEIQRLEEEERVRVFMITIVFSTTARWHGGDQPVEVANFRWDDVYSDDGGTSTAEAIELLCSALQIESLGRRCVPPLCVLLSDGHCTDPEAQYYQAIKQLDSLPWGEKAVRLSIGIGGQNEYNKAELDQFISPYLRAQGVETLPADTPRKLLEYIKLSVTTVTNRLVKPQPQPQPAPLPAPVAINMADLTGNIPEDDEPLPDPAEVFSR